MALTNKTPSLRDLLPDRRGGFANDPEMRQDPARPESAWIRPVLVAPALQSTYVVPGDWPAKPDHWFASDAPTYKWRHQNNVECFIDGEPTYEAMVEAIDTAKSSEHFIVLLGWTLHLDFALSKSGNRSSVDQQPLRHLQGGGRSPAGSRCACSSTTTSMATACSGRRWCSPTTG